MVFELGQLNKLIAGEHESLHVATLDDNVTQLIGWRLPFIHLSRKSCLHILQDHTDITKFDLLRLPLAIQRGELILEGDRNNCLAACYNDDETQKGYVAFLKRAKTSSDFEIWVSSFYRLQKRKLTKLRREGQVIRNGRVR
jgi:hypothetical protein